jgi:lysophospholipase L1-like esterase
MKRMALVALAACGSSSPAIDAASTTAPDATPEPAAEIHFEGRFTDDHRFAWSGSTIRTRFRGTTISATLEDGGQNQFDVIVDGEAQPLLSPTSGASTYVLAQGLADAEHDLVLARRTEGFFGVTRFAGFEGATLVATPARSRRIEFIGDSITAGYGVLGDSATCPFTADTEAETHAWGALVAADLGAAHTAIAYSGIGVYRDYGGKTTDQMPVRFERTFADDPGTAWDFAWTPQVVVVNLGTNDFAGGDPGQAYTDAYVSFVAGLRAHYPDAWILIAHSPMIDGANRDLLRARLDAVVAASGTKVGFVDIAAQLASDGYGCDYHPNEITARKMADVTAAKIREVTGWR